MVMTTCSNIMRLLEVLGGAGVWRLCLSPLTPQGTHSSGWATRVPPRLCQGPGPHTVVCRPSCHVMSRVGACQKCRLPRPAPGPWNHSLRGGPGVSAFNMLPGETYGPQLGMASKKVTWVLSLSAQELGTPWYPGQGIYTIRGGARAPEFQNLPR